MVQGMVTRVTVLLIIGTISVGLPGCSRDAAVNPSNAASSASGENAEVSSQSDKSRSATSGITATGGAAISNARPIDSWYADYIGDAHVGWTHLSIAADSSNVKSTYESEMTIKRLGTVVSQAMSTECVETNHGELVSFVSKSSSGGDVNDLRGSVNGQTLTIDTKTRGSEQKVELKWKSGVGGFQAVEGALLRRPMQPGEKRTVDQLIPVLMQVGTQSLQATHLERTDVQGIAMELLRIETQLAVGQLKIESTIWTDAKGVVVKSHIPAMNQTSVRVSADDAKRVNKDQSFDWGEVTLVRINNPPENLMQAIQVTYRVSLKDNSAIEGVFPVTPFQSVKVLSRSSAEVVVTVVDPSKASDSRSQLPPPEDPERLPTSKIESNHPAIVALSRSVESEESDPWKVGCALEKLVRAKMKSRQFAPAMASAATVSETFEGDCTEHAVLLAALARQRGIPSRVAVGLVYSRVDRAFAFHMWNEMWIRDQWVPMDGTRGASGINASYIKLAHSALDVGDDAAILLPVFQVLGRLEIQILSAK